MLENTPVDIHADWRMEWMNPERAKIVSPLGFRWRMTDWPANKLSRPTGKTVIILCAGLIGAVMMLHNKPTHDVPDFVDTLTHPQNGKNTVEELYQKVMTIARERAGNGYPNPGEVSVTIDTTTGVLKVLGKEINLDEK